MDGRAGRRRGSNLVGHWSFARFTDVTPPCRAHGSGSPPIISGRAPRGMRVAVTDLAGDWCGDAGADGTRSRRARFTRVVSFAHPWTWSSYDEEGMAYSSR